MSNRKEHDWVVGELELYITNDYDIYKEFLEPAYKACEKSSDKGTFNYSLALRLFKSIVNYGSNKYKRELDKSIKATMKAQTQVALNLLNDWEREYKLGNRYSSSNWK